MTKPLTMQQPAGHERPAGGRTTLGRRAALVGVVLAAGLAVTGCTDGHGPTPSPSHTGPTPVPTASSTPTLPAGPGMLLRGSVAAPGSLRLLGQPTDTQTGDVTGWSAVLTAADPNADAAQLGEQIRAANTELGWTLTGERVDGGYRLTGTVPAEDAATVEQTRPGTAEDDAGRVGAGTYLLVDVVDTGTGIPLMVRVLHTTVPAA